MAKFLLIWLSFLIVGCATDSKNLCAQADWAKLGLQDGENGRQKDSFQYRERECRISLSDYQRQSYEQSWETGNQRFCTAEGGYRFGVLGNPLPKVCSERASPDFFESHKMGLQVFRLQTQRHELRQQVQEVNKDNSSLSKLARAYSIFSGRSPTHDLDERISQIDDKIALIDNNAPGGPQVRSSSVIGQSDFLDLDWRKWGGAFAGTIYGFGIGHGIQGRYKSDGWKWTAGEVMTLGGLAAVSANACGDYQDARVVGADGLVQIQRQCQGNGPTRGLLPLALMTWIGFRIWQSYDLFTFPGQEYVSQSSTHQTLMVKGDGVIWLYGF